MSHKHRIKIEKIFEHPISGNIDEKRLLSALEHYGCSIDITKHNRAKIIKDDEECSLSLSHRNYLCKDDVVRIRHFLEKVGLTPDNLD